jgi:ribosomal protein S18 acetylase RimI-like enzyme
MAFIVGDRWQNLCLGTKMVDYVLEIAKEMGVENVYSIMLPDNYRAISLTKKMGFNLEYLSDGTVKGMLDLKEEVLESRCPERESLMEVPEAEPKESFKEENEKGKQQPETAAAPT